MKKILVTSDNQKFLNSLIDASCRFIIVGGTAVNFYLRERRYDDLDILVDHRMDNAERLYSALCNWPHDVDLSRFSTKDFARPKIQIPLKRTFYLDLLTDISEKEFAKSYDQAVDVECGGVTVKLASKPALIRLLQGSQEQKHKSDLEMLGALNS